MVLVLLLRAKDNDGIAGVAEPRYKNAATQLSFCGHQFQCLDTCKQVPRVGDTQGSDWRQAWAKVVPIQCVSVSGVLSLLIRR
jgi:hypothetical protein